MNTIAKLPNAQPIDIYQSPLIISYSAALNGFVPQVNLLEAFSYCDLGCGDGKNILALASVYPQAKFIGFEVDKELIKHTKEVAEQLNITNVQFIHGSFSQLSSINLAKSQFDFISISHIYSYISKENADELRQFVGQCLKEQGLLYLQYLSLPNQIATESLRKLIKTFHSESNNEHENVESAIKLLRQLAKRGLGFLSKNPQAVQKLRKYIMIPKISEQDCIRFADEFLSDYFNPYYFDEIFNDFQQQQLTFAGSCEFTLNDLDISIPPAQIPSFREIKTVNERELFKDYVLNTPARHDIFVKTAEKNIDAAHCWIRDNFSILSRQPKISIQRVISTNERRIPLQGIAFNALIDLADESIADLTTITNWQTEPMRYSRAMNRLLASGQYFLCQAQVQIAPEFEQDDISLTAFNYWQLEQSYNTLSPTQLVTDKTGGVAITLDILETLVLYFAFKIGWENCLNEVFQELKTARVADYFKKISETTEEDINKIIELLTSGQKAKNLMRTGVYVSSRKNQ